MTRSCLIAEYDCSLDTNKNGPHHNVMEVGIVFPSQLGGPNRPPFWMMMEKNLCCTCWESFPWLSNNSVVPTTQSEFKIIHKYIAFEGVYNGAS